MWLISLADHRHETNFNVINNILNGQIDSKLVKAPYRTICIVLSHSTSPRLIFIVKKK